MLKRHYLKPIGDSPPGLQAELAALCATAGLRPAPAFVSSRLFRGAQAFGWRGHYYVALGTPLVRRWPDQPAMFRAVVRHELAHLSNADVDKVYFTIALCGAFALIAVAPLALTLLDNPLAFSAGLGWRTIALAVLVALAGASILRARETYADLLASRWDGPNGGLRALLSSGRTARHWHPLRLHPEPQRRQATLDQTEPLFQTKPWDVFAIGVATTVAFQNIALLLVEPLIVAPLLPWALRPFAVGIGAGFLVAPLIVGVVGSGVWRATFAEVYGRLPRTGTGRLALALGAGALVGQKLSFFEFGHEQSEQALHGITLLLFDAAWCTLLSVCIAVFLHWVAESAEAWLPAAAALPSPRPLLRTGLWVAGSVLAVLLSIFYLAYLPRVGGPLLDDAAFQQSGIAPPATNWGRAMWLGAIAIAGVVLNPLTTLALTAMGTYPLLASLRRKPSTPPAWALLDGGQAQLLCRVARVCPRLVLVLGGAGGLIYAGMAVLAWSLLMRGGPIGVVLVGPISVGLPVLGMVVQAGVALVGAIRAPDLRVTHGIAAAMIAGMLSALCAILPFGLLGALPLGSALFMAAVVVNGGGLVALAIAFCVASIAKVARR
jgi:hypothetical protein